MGQHNWTCDIFFLKSVSVLSSLLSSFRVSKMSPPFKMTVCVCLVPKEQTLKLMVFHKAVGGENNAHIYEYLTTTDIWVLKQIYFHKYLKAIEYS